MKRFIIMSFILIMGISLSTNAQSIGYQATYNDVQQQSYRQQSQPQQQQLYSTTAYYRQGNAYVKLPIRVAIDNYNQITIKQMYIQTVVGGSWKTVNNSVKAQKCMSMSSDPLEKQFMYKCRIVSPAVTTIYFDL